MAMGGSICGANSNTDTGSQCDSTKDCSTGLLCCNNQCLCTEGTKCKNNKDCRIGSYCFNGICVSDENVDFNFIR